MSHLTAVILGSVMVVSQRLPVRKQGNNKEMEDTGAEVGKFTPLPIR